MAPTHTLRDVDPYALTICKQGANRQRIFLKKEHTPPTMALPASNAMLFKEDADWSAFYCVVAEPGAEEDGGIGAAGIIDSWHSEDEIRKAAHRFARNKGYVNAMHDAFAEQGCTVVENAVALSDMTVGDATIRKGSWYVAIEPSPEFRAKVDSGEITGVSLEGTGLREPVAKSDDDATTFLQRFAKALGLPAHSAQAQVASATDHSTEDENIMDQATVDAIKKQGEDNASAITALTGLVQGLVDRVTEATKQPPTVEDVKKEMEGVAETLATLQKSVDALAEGGSSQDDDDDDAERRRLAKAREDNPLAGILG